MLSTPPHDTSSPRLEFTATVLPYRQSNTNYRTQAAQHSNSTPLSLDHIASQPHDLVSHSSQLRSARRVSCAGIWLCCTAHLPMLPSCRCDVQVTRPPSLASLDDTRCGGHAQLHTSALLTSRPLLSRCAQSCTQPSHAVHTCPSTSANTRMTSSSPLIPHHPTPIRLPACCRCCSPSAAACARSSVVEMRCV